MNGPNKPECFSWEAFLAESNVCDHQGPYSKQFILFVTYKWAQLSRVFAPGMLFLPSLVFVGKAIKPALGLISWKVPLLDSL